MIPFCDTPLVFVMNTQFVLCEVVAESLHISEERQVSKCSHFCVTNSIMFLDPTSRTHVLIHSFYLQYTIKIRNYYYFQFLLITYYYYFLKNYIYVKFVFTGCYRTSFGSIL